MVFGQPSRSLRRHWLYSVQQHSVFSPGPLSLANSVYVAAIKHKQYHTDHVAKCQSVKPHVIVTSKSWYCNRCWWNLITFVTCAHRMPLRNRNSVRLKHTRPVVQLMRACTVFTKNKSTHKIIFTLGIVIPYSNDETSRFELLGCDVEANRLVEDRVQCVLLKRRLLGLYRLLEMHQCDFYKRILK